ncbi:multicopper oxidase-domain-containing protein [Xylaria curta]|nr:multicopper oxidase-domain-containing protein [Xylaria curta]
MRNYLSLLYLSASFIWLSYAYTGIESDLTRFGRTAAAILESQAPAKPRETPPLTGVTRYYNFTISRGSQSPDGVSKTMLLVNGQFPGPLIEAYWGDMIEVRVHNAIDSPKEGTAIHWHGLSQHNTPWSDGVPSIHQCPIAPGETFVYKFRAEEYGTSWWHAHYSGQYMDGAFGPMIFHGPENFKYDIDLGPILLTDYTHIEYFSYLLALYHIPPDFLPVDNNLINGKMPFNCSLSHGTICVNDASRSVFKFATGKTHLLRLINAGNSGIQKFSIDNHDLLVVTNDFVPIRPYKTNVVTLGVGQRSDVLVTARGMPTDAVWMRSELDIECLNVTSIQPNATAAVYYPKANTKQLPQTQGVSWSYNKCVNDPLSQTIPLYPKTPGQPDITTSISLTVGLNGTGNLVFYVNNSSFYARYGTPLLGDVFAGERSFSEHPESNVINFGSATSIRLIVKNHFPVMHTMHLHGKSDFWVLAEGFGDWDGAITNSLNPQRRDSQQLAPGTVNEPAFIVIQWETDNPGIWPFHCHVSTHASAGLYVNILQQPDLVKDKQIPDILRETCDPWNSYAKNHDVHQFDSGLKFRKDISHLKRRSNAL